MVLVNKVALQSRFLNQLTSSIGITPKSANIYATNFSSYDSNNDDEKTFINSQPHTNN
jgi:phage terminase small subunit